jgi:polar amino acid transport system substrate-binding protein
MQMDNLSNTSLGQFQLIEEIGRGGMSHIYRAHQPSMKREVAIKILSPALQSDSNLVERFNREVEVVAALQHPYIVPVYDFGEQNGLLFIAMAFVRGGTLGDLIQNSPKGMPVPDVVRIITHVADGLDYAHAKNIIHRDLKPGNILLDERKNPYIADFGLAKVLEQNQNQTLGTGLFGTPAYMAPESASQAPVNHQVDLYALGAILFEMLGGRKPYQSKSIGGLLSAHLHERIPNICELRPDLPPAIQGVIEKALAKNPAHRYQSAEAMVSDLHDVFPNIKGVTNMTPTPLPVVTLPVSVEQGKTKSWRWAVLAGIGALALVGGFLFFRNQASNLTPGGNQFIETNHPIKNINATSPRTWSFGCLGKAATAIVDLDCRTIVIALENRYLPFNYVGFESNTPSGFDYDMWWEICNKLHCEPIFIEHKWDGLIEAVGNDKFDVASGGVTITEERKSMVSFSISYMNIEQRLIVRRGETRFSNMNELAALADVKIGAQSDSTNLEIARQFLPEERIKTYNEYSVLLYALTIGEIDAAVVDNVEGQEQISGVDLADAKKLELIGPSLSSDQLGLAFQKDSDLLDPVNLALQQLRASGVLMELVNKYFGPNFTLTYDDVGLGAYGQ